MKIHEFKQTLVLIPVNHGSFLVYLYPENGAFFARSGYQKYPSFLLGILGSKKAHCIIRITNTLFFTYLLYNMHISLFPNHHPVTK